MLVGRQVTERGGKGLIYSAKPAVAYLMPASRDVSTLGRLAPRCHHVSALYSYSDCLKDRQRHSQWAHPLPKQPKQLPVPLDVNIPSACHLHHHPTPRLQPLLQQANQ